MTTTMESRAMPIPSLFESTLPSHRPGGPAFNDACRFDPDAEFVEATVGALSVKARGSAPKDIRATPPDLPSLILTAPAQGTAGDAARALMDSLLALAPPWFNGATRKAGAAYREDPVTIRLNAPGRGAA